MIFIKFLHLPNMQGISYGFIGFHENRWDAAAGGAAGGHPGTEYMDVLGTKEFIDSGGCPPEPMNPRFRRRPLRGAALRAEVLIRGIFLRCDPGNSLNTAKVRSAAGKMKNVLSTDVYIDVPGTSMYRAHGRTGYIHVPGTWMYPVHPCTRYRDVPGTSMYRVHGCTRYSPPCWNP